MPDQTNPISKQRFLSPTEAATFLGLSMGTLAVWRSTGRVKLPFVAIGGSIRYDLLDLERFLQDHKLTQTKHDDGRRLNTGRKRVKPEVQG